MDRIKKYLLTFKPVDFSSWSRLIGCNVFSWLNASILWACITVGHTEGIKKIYATIYESNLLFFGVPLLYGYILTLLIDLTFGFGRVGPWMK